MYHVAEIIRDAKRDMQARYESSTWAAYTPFPFLYALSLQITATMQRKAPNVIKKAVVATRDQLADVLVTTQTRLQDASIHITRSGQQVFYQCKHQIETAELPSAMHPIRSHVAVPLMDATEAFAQFVTSEELPEWYFVAKNRMKTHVILRHFVLPPLGVMENLVQYVVILPSQLVFPSKEELESRTDLFLDVSTSRVQSFVEYLYSATEVFDQHWSMVQWNILGRGPYASLSLERRLEVIQSMYHRMRSIEHSRFKLYEFMASVKVQNEMLYHDILAQYPQCGAVPLTEDEVAVNAALVRDLEEQNQHTFPCWFYRIQQEDSSVETKWIEFPAHENRRLERRYRHYERMKRLQRHPLPSTIVLVDQGRHEVDLARMEMTPVYWPPIDKRRVCRSIWLYAERNYGLAPYRSTAASTLERAFTFYLAHYDEEKRRLSALQTRKNQTIKCALNVPVDGHLVEFKGPHDMMQYKRLLAGTTPFTSKRRVYRGDPRIKSDAKVLTTWMDAMADDPTQPNADDEDLEQEIEHLVLIVHGMGDALKTIDLINVVTLRSIVDCAASLRSLHHEALQSQHFHGLGDKKPRVEFLPIEWHSKLHIDGLDNGIRDVTLPAIPKLREFANDTVLDVLFFMSPTFHHVILDQVAREMNRVVALFQARNPRWRSGPKISIIAHSLGAIICFDILSHQSADAPTPPEQERLKTRSRSESDKTTWECFKPSIASAASVRNPPQLSFTVENLFCLGSPVGLFLKVRGQILTPDFALPTCRRLFNIYHPYDPVAYRIEPIVHPARAHSKAAIIHTFEGKLRIQYQIRNSFRVMWQTLRQWKREFEAQVETTVHRVGLVETTLVSSPQPLHLDLGDQHQNQTREHRDWSLRRRHHHHHHTEPLMMDGTDEIYGRLCQGRPIDYTLQENEIEITNEYLFALTAHVIYWTNRDASLFIAQKLLLEPPEDDVPRRLDQEVDIVSPIVAAFSSSTEETLR